MLGCLFDMVGLLLSDVALGLYVGVVCGLFWVTLYFPDWLLCFYWFVGCSYLYFVAYRLGLLILLLV